MPQDAAVCQAHTSRAGAMCPERVGVSREQKGCDGLLAGAGTAR